MYSIFLVLHSLFRWLVVISLLFAIWRGWNGYRKKLPFRSFDNGVRHWTATIAHVQLVLGMILYTQSPLIKLFWKAVRTTPVYFDALFFGIFHAAGMLLTIVLITVGSALAKRKPDDYAKYKTMLIWFFAAFIVILVLVPWPFSPLSKRPFLR